MTGSSFYNLEKEALERSGGTTQAETRIYNERLIISLIRRRRQLSKVELTRLTGLSAQTITTLVNRAADHGLLLRLEPVRGRLGQPSVPYGLNPDGAYSFGVKIDRRSADFALINFVGEVVSFERITFDYPTPDAIMRFARESVAKLLRKGGSLSAERIAGLGIASPFYLWNWSDEIGAPPEGLKAWREVDIRAELDAEFSWPVYLFNDAMVAAAAELMFGVGVEHPDFLYAYIGYFIGGGVVLDHHLFPGRNKQAGSIGSILVPTIAGSSKPFEPLLASASLFTLAQRAGAAASNIWSGSEEWDGLDAILPEWVDQVSTSLAYAVFSAVAVMDVDNMVLDGAMPAFVRKAIARATRQKLAVLFTEPREPFSILEGSYGHHAPALGGATIPFLIKYSNDKEILFKD